MTQHQSSTLKPVDTIRPQDWMRDPATVAIMAALQDQGVPVQALFVGGCVRNALMGRQVGDIDIATVHSPAETTRRLEAAGLKAVPTGIDHGTVTGVAGGKGFEITTLRKDVETDGRRAVVAFTDDWAEDAQRRDFTINTLLMDAAGNVYDPTGQGLKDLKAGRVVFVGDPGQRIGEDYLRILRFFRFQGCYGGIFPSRKALAACKAASSKIATLSRERITQEFFKILALENAASILKLMFDHNVLKELSANFDKKETSTLCKLQAKYNLMSPAARLFLLAGLDKNNVHAMEKLLLFPNVFLKNIEAIYHILELGNLDTDHKLKIALYKYGRPATLQAFLIGAARGDIKAGHVHGMVKAAFEWEIPVFPVSGDDLIKKGMKPGPELGAELARLEQEWIAREFK